jgi:hypothetical protein
MSFHDYICRFTITLFLVVTAAHTPTSVGKNLAVIFFYENHFVLYPINISIWTTLFLLICHVFIVLYGVLPLYCVFETCKVKSILKLIFRGIRAIVLLPLYQFSQPFPEQINAKQKLFFNLKVWWKSHSIILFIF